MIEGVGVQKFCLIKVRGDVRAGSSSSIMSYSL